MPANPSARKDSGTSESQNFKFPGIDRVFRGRDAAAKFLRGQPKYVAKHGYLLKSQFPGAFKQAGYRVKADGISGKIQVLRSGTYEYKTRTGETRTGTPSWTPVGSFQLDPKTKKPFPTAKPKSTPTATPTPTPQVTPTVAPVDPTAPGVFDTSGFDALNPATAALVDVNSFMQKNAPKQYGAGVAEAQSGLQFDGQLNELRRQQAQAPLDQGQQQKDVGSWYKQVLDSLRTASGRDDTATADAVGSVGDATASIVGALGGEANQGSALVGAAGASAAGTIQAMGHAQDQYNSDMQPLIQLEAAGARSRVAAQGSARSADLAQQLAITLGQKGQSRVTNQFAVDQANNAIISSNLGTRAGLMDQNNKSRQTNFGNAFGVEQAKGAARISGLQLAGQQSQANPAAPTWGTTSMLDRKRSVESIFRQAYGPNGRPVGSREQSVAALRAATESALVGYSPQEIDAIFKKVVFPTAQSKNSTWWKTGKHVQAQTT